jgi:hypothetical protein
VSVLLAASSSAMPMAWMLVGLVVATAVSFAVLARR